MYNSAAPGTTSRRGDDRTRLVMNYQLSWHHRLYRSLSRVVLGLLLVGVVDPSGPSLSFGKLEDRIVAVVNSELITLSEINQELITERDRLRQQYQGEELARRLQSMEYEALTRMIERKLQLQLAKDRGILVSEQEVKQALEELKQQGEKVDPADLSSSKSVKEQLTLLKVVDREVRSTVMVVRGEIQRYYEEHKDRFAYPEEYKLSQILIRATRPDTLSEAREKAQEAVREVKNGGAFDDLALRYSDGLNAPRGGQLGYVRQGELLPPIERALSSLAIGDISDVVETSQGFHILRVDDKKPRQFRPFDEVRAEIQGLLFQQKSEDRFQTWMADLKHKAYIEIKF